LGAVAPLFLPALGDSGEVSGGVSSKPSAAEKEEE
jgi:hypothetical protein